jgi:flagellar biosynthesis/type III secretory pathway M-ring protein FliF/YscJ
MTFLLFMTVFTLITIFILWMVFRSAKPKVIKKSKRPTKQITSKKTTVKPVSDYPNAEQKQKIITELMKKDPVVVSKVIKKWLREK